MLTSAQFCIVLEVQYHIVVLEQQCTLVFLAVQEQWNILVLELVDNLVGEHCHIFVGVFVLEPIKIYPNLYLIIQSTGKNCDFKIILFWITYPTTQVVGCIIQKRNISILLVDIVLSEWFDKFVLLLVLVHSDKTVVVPEKIF